MQNSQVASIIKDLCKQNKVTITQLINECGFTRSLIYDMEKRDKTPSADKLETIANYFNCSVDYILGRTDIPFLNK